MDTALARGRASFTICISSHNTNWGELNEVTGVLH